jgi:rhodanese-related sulfurtransferase
MHHHHHKHQLGRNAALAAMVLLAGTLSIALAQGSGTKPAGSATRTTEEENEKDKPEVKAELNAEALKALLGAKVPMVLLDARGPSDQWIAGAVPLAHDADEKAIRRVVGKPNRLIVTYCGGPECPMSLMLANNLTEHGYTNVIRFTGGIEAWTNAGLELTAKDDAKGSDTKKPSGSSAKPSGSDTR